MSGHKKFDYEKVEKQTPESKEDTSLQANVMKGLQILLGILMAIFHA